MAIIATIKKMGDFAKELGKAAKEKNKALTLQAAAQQHTGDTASAGDVIAVCRSLTQTLKNKPHAEIKDENVVFNEGAGWAVYGTNALLFKADDLKDLCNTIKGMTYYASQKKWMDEAMAKVKLSTAAAEVTAKGVASRLLTILRGAPFGAGPAAPQAIMEETLAEACAVQFYQSKPGAQVVSVAPYALPEIIFTLEGVEIVLGFDIPQLPGDDLAQKVKKLEEMEAISAMELAKQIGFIRCAQPGSAIMVPAGVVLVIVPIEIKSDVHGFRWSVTGDQRGLVKASNVWEQYCDAFPTKINPTGKAMLEKYQGFIDVASA